MKMKSSVEIWSGLLFLRAALLLSALTAPPVAGQESRILYSLAGYWPLDGNLSDARNVNHGAAVEGGIAYVSRGIDSGFGGAVELSGNEFIEIASVNLGIELSVSLWCEIDDQSPDQVLVSIGSASPWTIGVTAGGGIVFNVGEERLESDVLEKGVHHIVVTTEVYNRVSRASRLSLFVDSNFEAVADVPNLYFPGGRLRIGASDDAGGRHWNGMVDEVAVWRRVISEQEVRILWADGKGRVLGMEMPDADGDRIPDYWEIAHGLDPNADDREQDSDDDGLSNIDEFRFGTNPESVDSDRDGLPDGSESGTGKWSGENDTGTSPLALDSDRDGLADSLENPDRPSLTRPPTDPNQYDSDSDGVPDFYEVLPSYNPPFRVDGIHASDQRRLQISLPSRADTYYVLFRSNSPQFDGGGTAVSGALGNNDLLEFYPGRRAEGVYFYRVAKFTPPVDLDSDGVDDFMEAYSGSALAPLNPATKIRYLDGVVRIPDLATLEAMSSIVPPGPEVPDARQHVVKFVVTDLPDQPRELYFLNTKTHSNHQLFVKATGLKCLEIYQCINAEFSYFPNLQTGAGENGLFAVKFDGGLSSDDAMEVFDLVAANLPVAKGNIAVRDKNLRPNNISDLRAAGIQVLTDDEIGADEITYLGLNEGEAFGRLRVIEQGQRPSLRDIAIYKTIPNDVPHIAGTITEQEQTPLSHVNLRAIQNRAPNAYIRDASTSERIAPLIGQYVYFRVNNTGYEIRKADQAEVDAFFVGIRPLASQVPPRDLTFT
ncbi:MAG: LamG domain-containing protein, partial [Verrucomicrobiae bacterium]|nr:LamG domain-containing protein [Verrucomicrobiae bacterium]